METKVEALEDSRVQVTVTIDAKDVDARIKRTYKEFAQRYNFPGFRKGKAPRPVIDNALGAEAVLATVSEDLVNDAYPQVVEAEALCPVGRPEFGDAGLVEGGKPYEFTFTVEVKPELTLSSYDPVAVELPPEGATDAEVEEQIETLRGHYTTFEDASAATKLKPENFVDIALVAKDADGKELEGLCSESRLYGPGSGMFSEAFDEEIMGVKKGQVREFTLDVPADEEAVLLAPYAGQKVQFEVTCNVVKKKELPEVTDEWAKDTMGFEDVADLRERIAESITAQKADILPRMKENASLEQLAERLEGEVPAGMVEEAETSLLQDFFTQLQRQGMSFDTYLMQLGITSDQFKEDVKAQALDNAKQELALEAWARHYGIAATPEEVSEEFVKAGLPDPAAVEKEWRDSGRLHLIREGVIRSKAMDDVMDKAVVTEVDLSAKEDKPKKSSKKKAAKAEADSEEAAE